jgi:hypothetical protein
MRSEQIGTIGVAAVLLTGLATLAFAFSGLAGLGKDVRSTSDANAPSFHQIRSEYVRNADPERELYLRGAWQKAEQRAVTDRAAEQRREAAEAEAALSAAQADSPYDDGYGDGQHGVYESKPTPEPTPPAPITSPRSEL